MKVRLAVLTGMAGVLAACGEAPTAAPVQKTVELAPPYNAAAVGGPSFSLSGDVQTSITVDPTTTNFYQIGAHWVYIPAGAMCRLDSSYGPSEWDKDCVSATEKVTIPVTVGSRDGRPTVYFGVDLRFKPTREIKKAAYLFFYDAAVETDVVNKYQVLWQDAAGTWIDEAAVDKTLRVFRVNKTWFGRRVKHFSGYNVSLGIAETSLELTVE